ncbi:hypothetical protein L6255_01030 [Candidatus Parcubacteria bacterium]|nr:hypothetical protein [Patescibacteria group bacterium]MCG2689004.1 hypothetical protein [Candidatus Parcubacteria bacterium]
MGRQILIGILTVLIFINVMLTGALVDAKFLHLYHACLPEDCDCSAHPPMSPTELASRPTPQPPRVIVSADQMYAITEYTTSRFEGGYFYLSGIRETVPTEWRFGQDWCDWSQISPHLHKAKGLTVEVEVKSTSLVFRVPDTDKPNWEPYIWTCYPPAR